MSTTTITRFGQTMLDDYGDDDLSHLADAHDTTEACAAEQRFAAQVTALLGPDMPAVADKPFPYRPAPNAGAIDYLTDMHPIEAIRTYNNLREPDLYDNEQAIWVTNRGMLACPLGSLQGFNAYVRCRGLAPGGYPAVTTRQFHGETLSLWAFVQEVCCP